MGRLFFESIDAKKTFQVVTAPHHVPSTAEGRQAILTALVTACETGRGTDWGKAWAKDRENV